MCAVIKRGILGGFSNKIGNIVGTSWKGVAVMKSLPLSVSNPRTAGQMAQRSKFAAASFFGSTWLAAIVKPLNDRFAQNESGFNAFVRRNINDFNVSGLAILGQVSISQGKLEGVPNLVVTGAAGSGQITFTYGNNAGVGFALATDQVYVGLYGLTGPLPGAMIGGETRASSPAVWQGDGVFPSGSVVGYSFALRRADGTMVSTSQDGTVTIP